MSEPIRILQVFAQMNRGGAETMIMNLYRHIDRSKVQFDFIVHTEEKCAFDEEIEQLGGKIYKLPRYTGVN
ncbi:MAG: glycosyltransferase family 1 protein, partial [Clostridiales bacterium]|nr:glycosyltransferase family 1 protein [Clostridiales bacterium]